MQDKSGVIDNLFSDETYGLTKIDLQDFIDETWINEDLEQVWIKNYASNRVGMKIHPITYRAVGKACIFVGSSPAIKKNVHLLKDLEKDFLIISCNGALKYIRD